jgi:hypothetical protein
MSAFLVMVVACSTANESIGEFDLGGVWHWVCYCDGQDVEDVLTIEDQGDTLVVLSCDGNESATWTQDGTELTHTWTDGTRKYTSTYTVVGTDYFGNDETGDDAVWACKVKDDLKCPANLDAILAQDCLRQDL